MTATRGFFLLIVFSVWLPGADAEVTENSRAAGLTECVEPTGLMRRNHMDLLLHQRDETVHEGQRERKHSLTGCVECHAARTSEGSYLAINGSGQFCQACHVSNAVSMDCFQCHATKPDPGSVAVNE